MIIQLAIKIFPVYNEVDQLVSILNQREYTSNYLWSNNTAIKKQEIPIDFVEF